MTITWQVFSELVEARIDEKVKHLTPVELQFVKRDDFFAVVLGEIYDELIQQHVTVNITFGDP